MDSNKDGMQRMPFRLNETDRIGIRGFYIESFLCRGNERIQYWIIAIENKN